MLLRLRALTYVCFTSEGRVVLDVSIKATKRPLCFPGLELIFIGTRLSSKNAISR